MPLSIRGKNYPLPKENNEPGPTGREIIGIETYFNLDGLRLLSVLGDDQPDVLPAYTKAKALYSVAWISMTRGGEVLSIEDVLNEYSIDEIQAADEDPKASAGELSSEVEPAAE